MRVSTRDGSIKLDDGRAWPRCIYRRCRELDGGGIHDDNVVRPSLCQPADARSAAIVVDDRLAGAEAVGKTETNGVVGTVHIGGKTEDTINTVCGSSRSRRIKIHHGWSRRQRFCL